MAKEKRSAADIDAELAALEAEIAALEGKPAKKPRKAEAPPAPKAETPATAAPAAQEAPAEAKRGRFSLPFKRGKGEPAAPETAPPPPPPAPVEERAPEPVAYAMPPEAPRERYDLTLWREESGAWVRTVRETPPVVVRRILDEKGELVREEPASMADIDEARGVKAERGLGRLLRRK